MTGAALSDPSITIHDVNNHDAGTYRCILVNGAGQGHGDVQVEVLPKGVYILPVV